MEVKEIMTRKPITVTPEENTALAARLLHHYNIGALPVCTEDGRLRGLVTDRDIVMRCIASGEEPEETKISHIMTRKMVTVAPEASVEQAAALMAREQVRRLPVSEGGKLVGILSLGDIAKMRDHTMEAGETLCEISENIRRS